MDPANADKPVKFPMHFDTTWILSGFERNILYVAELDASNMPLVLDGP